MTNELKSKLQVAQVAFVTAASRLLDEAEEVREQRDEFLRLLRLVSETEQEVPANG